MNGMSAVMYSTATCGVISMSLRPVPILFWVSYVRFSGRQRFRLSKREHSLPYWTIQHAIDMRVMGVGFGVDVFAVEPSGELEDAEVAEHSDFMKAAEEAMRAVRQALTVPPKASPDVGAPPTLK
jgi:hypothetical protein